MQTVRTQFIVALAIIAALLLAGLYFGAAQAHGWHDHDLDIDNSTTNNYYGNEGGNDCLCISNGLSDHDYVSGLSMAMASGAHELDFSTTMHQLSLTYAMPLDETDEGAYSIKYGKKFEFLPEALMHLTFNPEQGNELLGDVLIIGGTIRF
jgi:hypothetical protein